MEASHSPGRLSETPDPERQLRLFEALLASTPDLVYLFDRSHRYLCVSHSGAAVVGRTPDDFRGRSWRELGLPAEHSEPFEARLEEALSTGRVLKGEVTYPTVAGLRDYEYVIAPVQGPDGAVEAAVVTARDITDRKQAEEALRASEDQFRRLAEDAPDVIYRYEILPARRYAYINPAVSALIGYTPEEHYADPELGLKIIHPEDAEVLASTLAGEPAAQSLLLRWRHRDGHTVWTETRLLPERDEEGRLVAVEGIARDVSQRIEAEREREQLLARERAARAEAQAERQRFAFLAEAGTVLVSSLEAEAVLEQLARLAVPVLGDWCIVDLFGEAAAVHTVAIAHVDSGKEALARQITRRYPPDAAGEPTCPRLLAEGVPIPVTEELLRTVAQDAEHLRLLQEIGPRASLTVPLIAHGRTLGLLTFVVTESERQFTTKDVALARELAQDAALALENTLLYRRQREVAHTLQASLLPPRLPLIRGIELAASYRPAYAGVEIGGDFYDLFPLNGDWMLGIGDVSGKGLTAAATTALARYTTRAVALYERRPSRVLARLNEAILHHPGERSFCTMALARLESRPGSRHLLTLACGGHPLPLLCRAGEVRAVGRIGTLLGAVETPELHDVALDFRHGDTLVFYTDGVTEAGHGSDMFGEERLASVIAASGSRSPAELAASIEQAVLEFQHGEPRDDVALLILRAA